MSLRIAIYQGNLSRIFPIGSFSGDTLHEFRVHTSFWVNVDSEAHDI
jgi:hypothetical protein